MWLVLNRPPPPDAPYWPGRRLLALVDAVGWPLGWMALAASLPQPAGIVGPMIMALAALSALCRAPKAVWVDHRYHFTTWRWGRWVLILLLIGLVLRVALQV